MWGSLQPTNEAVFSALNTKNRDDQEIQSTCSDLSYLLRLVVLEHSRDCWVLRLLARTLRQQEVLSIV
jgi:hypothetical protein